MDLREAIEVGEKMAIWMHQMDQPHSRADSEEAKDLILSAAKRELARLEKEKPKRMPLEQLEGWLRKNSLTMNDTLIPGAIGFFQAADVLKALREVVVPWLRDVDITAYPSAYKSDRFVGSGGAQAMLRALGEQP